MLLLIIFSLLLFFSVLECAKDVKYQNELENFVKNYVKPLKVLTANLPNHEIEIQIEYQNPTERKPIRPQALPPQGPFYVYNPLTYTRHNNLLPLRRSNQEVLDNPGPSNQEVRDNPVADRRSYFGPDAFKPKQTWTNTGTYARLPPVARSNSSAQPNTDPPPSTSEDPLTSEPPAGKQPIYLEDLKKVLDDFVKKIQETNAAQQPKASDQPVIGNPPKLEDVLQLMKQGSFLQLNSTLRDKFGKLIISERRFMTSERNASAFTKAEIQ